MGVCGKVSRQVGMKCDVSMMYELFRYAPNNLTKVCPHVVQGCDLLEGQWGSLGSIIFWHYTDGSGKKVSKERIDAIDEEKKLISFRAIEGELLKAYKSFVIIFEGADDKVTWTLEYEKINEATPDPTPFLELLVKVTKDIEANHQAIPRQSTN